MFCQEHSALSDFRAKQCLLFTEMALHICYLPHHPPLPHIIPSFSLCIFIHFCPLTSPQEFIRHKLEEEQRQLEILQQQLLQEQALLMVTCAQ